MTRTLTLIALLLLALGCTPETIPESEPHRMTFVASRGPIEAYDATIQVLAQNFPNMDPGGTDRDGLVALTEWVQSEEPERLARVRARAIIDGPAGGSARVQLFVERQFSTTKTEYGDLNKSKPVWVSGVNITDSTLENKLMGDIRARLGAPTAK
ncbi:MAG: hypothetical protein P1V97_16090 [Planctomycetota bacterium]|nr:hypothetical protein [Planctomycetota bacterium]